jgi:hypothetical protein
VRRALRKPISDVPVAIASTASALHGCNVRQGTCTPPSALTSHVSNRPASRTSVSTNIDENQPMLIRPTHLSTSPIEALRAMRRDRKGSGMVAADTTSSTSASGHAGVSIASAGNRRRAM